MMYHQIKFGCKKISTLVAMTETVVFDYILALTVTLTLKIANQSFHMTLWSMMLHHQTKFGYKRFSSWEDTTQKNIHWHFESLLWPWPWTQQNILIFSKEYPAYAIKPSLQHNTPAHDITSPYQVWLQKVEWFQSYHPDNIPWHFKPSLWPWPQQSKFSKDKPVYEHVPSNQTKFDWKRIKSIELRVKTVIFWLNRPLPWSWPWR